MACAKREAVLSLLSRIRHAAENKHARSARQVTRLTGYQEPWHGVCNLLNRLQMEDGMVITRRSALCGAAIGLLSGEFAMAKTEDFSLQGTWEMDSAYE